MGYWEHILSFHERYTQEFPRTKEGFNAVLFLNSFFEKIGCDGFTRDHPLDNRLSAAFPQNYAWLIEYSRKLLTATSIQGFEQVARRLGSPQTFLAANNEIDVALKLSLQNMEVMFPRISSSASPDLVVVVGDKKINVEVTSLNPPEQESFANILFSTIFGQGARKRVASGGFVGKVPTRAKLQEILETINKGMDQAIGSQTVQKLDFPGIAMIYLAPYGMVGQMPEDCRGQFRSYSPSRKPIDEQMANKIKEKIPQLFQDNGTGILFLYTHILGREDVLGLFDRDLDDMEIVLASYRKLHGLVLTVPHREIGVPSATASNELRRRDKGNKALIECSTGRYQNESSVVWSNLHADARFPSEVVRALENYPSNLDNLAPLQESFLGFSGI